MIGPGGKRLYGHARAVAADAGQGYEVHLDARPLALSGGAPLRLPGRPLARAVAAEWEAQADRIDTASMPLTGLAMTAAERLPAARDGVLAGLLRYVESDLLCHRADAPDILVQAQADAWQPLLDWAAVAWGARFAVTVGVMPQPQAPATTAAMAGALAGFDDWHLAALSSAVSASGSLIIGLALVSGHIGADAALGAAHVDETYQAARWGLDGEAARRRGLMAREFAAIAQFVGLLAEADAV